MLQDKNMALRWDTRRVRINYFTGNRGVNCIYTGFWRRSMSYSFYFPKIQGLKENWPADSEACFQCMDVAAPHLTRGPKQSMTGQISEQQAWFAFSSPVWFHWKCRECFHTLQDFLPPGKNPVAWTGCTAQHLLYLHSANCLKLKSWLSLTHESKRKTGVVTCHTQVS